MDNLDKAKDIEIRQRQAGIDAVTNKLAKTGTINCIDCGEVIPEARRRAYPAAVRCVTCQQEVENGRDI